MIDQLLSYWADKKLREGLRVTKEELELLKGYQDNAEAFFWEFERFIKEHVDGGVYLTGDRVFIESATGRGSAYAKRVVEAVRKDEKS